MHILFLSIYISTVRLPENFPEIVLPSRRKSLSLWRSHLSIESPRMDSAYLNKLFLSCVDGRPIGGGRGPAGGAGGASAGDAPATAGQQQGGCGADSRGRKQGRIQGGGGQQYPEKTR